MKKIIIANWKMNPNSLKEAKKIFNDIKKTASRMPKVETIICPPFPYISNLKSLGAQDVFYENPPAGGGAYTGEISANMLKDLGVKYVIIGHSERRNPPVGGGETNEMINKKIKRALEGGLRVVFCVGEKERDSEGHHLNFLKNQINEGLKGVPRKFFNPPAGGLIIAYEPVWAISSNKNAQPDNPESCLRMTIFIRRMLLPIMGGQLARSIPVLYGGSVGSKNAGGFLKDGGVQGLLVGSKSLIPGEFGEILKIANT